MKNTLLILSCLAIVAMVACTGNQKKETATMDIDKEYKIPESDVSAIKQALIDKFGSNHEFRISKGVNQVIGLWRNEDGSIEKLKSFCLDNFLADPATLDMAFNRISRNLEIVQGNFHKMNVGLKEPLHVDDGEKQDIDNLFGSYAASSHFADDMYKTKIAFYVALNFPSYSLKEKSKLADKWTRKEWAYARMGDMFTSRIPAKLYQDIANAYTQSDSYISDYNIFMGNLIDEEGKTWFPKEMKLITHWGLRDELKSNYAIEQGLLKQDMIYSVMKNIISQEIPQKVINSDKYRWNPKTNQLFENGEEVTFEREQDTRYQKLLDNFLAVKAIDPYEPQMPTYIHRAFDGNMEITQPEVEALFSEFVSSPQVKQVAELIKKRLGRDLRPYDIWYDGFKSRSSINEEELNKIVSEKYPNVQAFQNDLSNILIKLGFKSQIAQSIADKIKVDPSRGAGHAWGAEMRDDKSRLRTRFGKDGMDYKGYNIAIHEFGHNVEQTITLHDVDNYMLHGVPNTAFTEAIAFLFQARDLELLGMKSSDGNKHHLKALDNFWSSYEIMGVSLVDMNVWKWLYANPDASAAQLKEAVISIAKDIWNKYYADVFGSSDEPILAIYSHMIDNPLYLSNYPVGHLIDFQIEKYIEDKNLADEITRMLVAGRIIPQAWMKEAVGEKISIKPVLDATSEALKVI